MMKTENTGWRNSLARPSTHIVEIVLQKQHLIVADEPTEMIPYEMGYCV